jgi:hypothetical protein
MLFETSSHAVGAPEGGYVARSVGAFGNRVLDHHVLFWRPV